eukprot:scaffold103115_cov37-Tisochrysis_lutea.AAC.2
MPGLDDVGWRLRSLDFREQAGWPWESEAKRRLRDSSRFDESFLHDLYSSLHFLTPERIKLRDGDPPVTHDQYPHCQLTQQTPRPLLRALIARATDHVAPYMDRVHVTHASTRDFSAASPCFVLTETIRLPAGLARDQSIREFACIHAEYQPQYGWTERQGGGGGSMHVLLAPRDASLLIHHGLAEWHPAAHESQPLVLLYAPRNGAELELSLHVLDAACRFILSSDFD